MDKKINKTVSFSPSNSSKDDTNNKNSFGLIQSLLENDFFYTPYIASIVTIIAVAFFVFCYVDAQKSLESSVQKIETITNEKKRLETENSNYQQQLSKIQQKAIQIENKLEELEQLKDNLYRQVNDAIAIESKSIAHTPKFTALIITPYAKIARLSYTLERLEQTVSKEELTFVNTASDVTQTLSFMQSKPSIWPVNGKVTSEFSERLDPFNHTPAFHKGIDIYVPTGTAVKATANGVVISARLSKSFGYVVQIDHKNGFQTLYAHNSKLDCKTGDTIKKGDTIAFSGQTGYATGPHVHYEITLNGEYQNPREYLK